MKKKEERMHKLKHLNKMLVRIFSAITLLAVIFSILFLPISGSASLTGRAILEAAEGTESAPISEAQTGADGLPEGTESAPISETQTGADTPLEADAFPASETQTGADGLPEGTESAPLSQISNETKKSEVNTSITTKEVNTTEAPDLDVQLSYPSKITRGESVELKAIIINSGARAGNVAAHWILPDTLKIFSGNQTEDCGNLDMKEFCISKIRIQTLSTTSLGKNQIKIVVGYENE